MRSATVMTFSGRFRPASFRAFAEYRARLLDLTSVWGASGSERMVVTVSGQSDFVDAFEMACSLGPMDCLIHDVERCEAAPADGMPGPGREHDDG
ncbi:hypothetical protein [Methylobacterium sp. Leaf89]|uniref:hypothetical protein n=1 Tax=Methylobacterium sp. Leaf89 TaxID=1736245 RepID=UPI0006F8CBDF|nr:hypothetical protein [Methylobacterium sp. Leaf89]KQO73596.1 hypothetical protein ASF18_17675 [Methylobacterium sp. Leaf89]